MSRAEVTIADGVVPCVLYGSTSDEDERGSTVRQLEMARAAAEAEDRVVVAEYSDEAMSGFSGNRGENLARAIEHAKRLAQEHGSAELWVRDPSRIARGDSEKAKHLIEYRLELQRENVRLRAAHHDDDLTGRLSATASSGDRANDFSKTMSDNLRSAIRAIAETGEWRGGLVCDGYAVLREINSRGKVARAMIKDYPDRAPIYDLIWSMALAGHSVQSIQLELSTRGYLTAAVRRDHVARPFDAARVKKTLDNPFYAGIVVHKGETLSVPGNWPRFVEPEDFYRLQAERHERGHVTKRGPGRPPLGYLLAGLAKCPECGSSMHAQTSRFKRKDGTYARYYVCCAHRDHHAESAERCPAMPVDAVRADGLVLRDIDGLLSNAEAVRERLDSGRTIKREKHAAKAAAANDDVAKCERALATADRQYADALAHDDEDRAEAVLRGQGLLREDLRQATARRDAEVAALASFEDEDPEDEQDVIARILSAISGQVRDADGDVRKLNMTLREWFEQIVVGRDENGMLVLTPLLSDSAAARIRRDPASWPHGVTVPVAGRDARVLDADDETFTLSLRLDGDAEDVTLGWPVGDMPDGAIEVHSPPALSDAHNLPSPRDTRVSSSGLALPPFVEAAV